MPDQGPLGSCQRCGRPLAEAGPPDDSDAATIHASPATVGHAPELGDDALVADLRDAFGHGADALGVGGPGRLTGPAASSVFAGRAPIARTLPTGTRLGDFEIIGELGRGGMGVVYRARQVSLGREVALKVLPDHARRAPMAVQRFKSEAQAAARLHHTNVVAVYAQGEQDGSFFYAMELVDGVGLDTVIHSRPDLLSSTRARSGSSGLTPAGTAADANSPAAAPTGRPGEWTRADYRHVAGLLAEVADALEAAHQQGVIHRDIKPHNMLLSTSNRLHLTDFGLARLVDEPHLTVSGELMGTPHYLSPEQIRGHLADIDHRTDIYSLGVTLYELTTRCQPFEGDARDQIIYNICHTDPARPRHLNPRIPVELETICLRAMAREPNQRHPSAALVAEDLRRFATGRPILSRRTTPLRRAAKWVRRHKAPSAALGAAALVVLLAVGLVWTIGTLRQREGERLALDAYEQLAFLDYRQHELVTDKLSRAAALGADSPTLHLARALAALGAMDQAGATSAARRVLADNPRDTRAAYLLAWAQQRDGNPLAARAAFDAAEQHGPPDCAAAWCFRGLAMHTRDPAQAIESYRAAIAARARQHEFYPLAVLHLARARNQLMYESRSLDGFAEAEASLLQLVEHGHYDVYPYYLLSIAHCLAAEIYSGSSGTRGDEPAQRHYAASLDWARRGQPIDPSSDRCHVAEATCLESMGRFEEALAVRTAALEIATRPAARCENYHYRWRLYYWLGDLQAADDDVAAHSACMPDNRLYTHVFPALLLAETGDMAAALAHARAIADDDPDSALAVLWSATCLRLLGQPEEATALLDQHAGSLDFEAGSTPPQSPDWIAALYEHCRTDGPLTPLLDLAGASRTPWRLLGEAYFHAGIRRLAEGDRAAALECFNQAHRCFDGELRYTYLGKLLMEKLRENPSWPAWLGV